MAFSIEANSNSPYVSAHDNYVVQLDLSSLANESSSTTIEYVSVFLQKHSYILLSYSILRTKHSKRPPWPIWTT